MKKVKIKIDKDTYSKILETRGMIKIIKEMAKTVKHIDSREVITLSHRFIDLIDILEQGAE